ncbi:MAG: hypothetical protein ACI4OY_00950 [Aristaeellaceae bacterium]
MTRLFKKITALLVCLCLLVPCLAGAEGAHAVRFTLEAEVNPDAYPEADRSLMAGLEELIDIISLEGTFEYNEESCIDLNVQLMLEQAEETRTTFRLYGCEDTWALQSNLLGDQQLFFPLTSLLEFCMKAYFHLNVPLQRVGLLLTPYVHKDAFATFASLWNSVMNASEGSRTIAREDVLDLAAQIGEAAWTDRAFTYWVMAVALESGYDTAITDAFTGMQAWADSFLGKDGVTVTVAGEDQTWSTGGTTLFSRTVRDGWTTLSLSLPATPQGYVLSGFLTMRSTGATLNADARLTVTLEGESILDLRFSADDLPLVIPASGPFAFTWDATGDAVPDGFHLRFEGESEDGAFTIRQLDAATGDTMLTLRGTAAPGQNVSPLNWSARDLDGLAFFSVSDTTLSQFAADVLPTFARGALPLLVHAPVKACQALMDLVTGTGILDLMTSSTTRLDSVDEESYIGEGDWMDEEGFFDEEGWGDEEGFFDEEGEGIDWDDPSLYE